MSIYKVLMAFFLAMLCSVDAQAGIVVGGTRFIYKSSDENGISVLIKNSGATNYIVQAKVINSESADVNTAFIITPPLFKLSGNHDNTLRVIHTGGNLPEDRESAFRLSIATIPEGRPETHTLQLAFRSQFKLFFRPRTLKGNPALAYEKLSWKRSGANITVNNPTPFYVTLFNLTVNGKTEGAAGMVAPFGSRTETWCPVSGQCHVRWQTLNDYGAVMPAWQVLPSSDAEQSLGEPL